MSQVFCVGCTEISDGVGRCRERRTVAPDG